MSTTDDRAHDDAPRPKIVPALLLVSEAAAYLGVSRRTLERIAASGVLPVVQLKGADHRRRFSRKDLDAYIHDSVESA
jgi:excisionase family DNA binding protein